MHWRYCSLALTHWYIMHVYIQWSVSSLVAPKCVMTTTSGATSDDEVNIMTTLFIQCIRVCVKNNFWCHLWWQSCHHYNSLFAVYVWMHMFVSLNVTDDNLLCHQWWQSWHSDNSQFPMYEHIHKCLYLLMGLATTSSATNDDKVDILTTHSFQCIYIHVYIYIYIYTCIFVYISWCSWSETNNPLPCRRRRPSSCTFPIRSSWPHPVDWHYWPSRIIQTNFLITW